MKRTITFRLRTQVVRQGERRFFLGKISREFIEQAKPDIKIDTRDPQTNPAGYQRCPSQKRIKDFGNYVLNSKGLCPTNLVFNIRPEDMAKVRFVETDHPDFVDICFYNTPAVLYVVEGQHRIKGWESVCDDLAQGFDLAVAFTNTEPEEEMEQFNIINSTQKGVSTALLFEMKATLYDNKKSPTDWFSKPHNIRSQAHETSVACKIVNILQTDPMMHQDGYSCNVLYNRLREANAPRADTYINKAQFGKYLFPAIRLRGNIFPRDETQFAVTVAAFWGALMKYNKPAFREEHGSYLLTKHVGVRIMNELFIAATRVLVSRSLKLSPGNYHGVLHPIADSLTPEYWHHKTGVARFYHGAGSITEAIQSLSDQIYEGNGYEQFTS